MWWERVGVVRGLTNTSDVQMGRSTVDEAFEEVLRDYPDLRDAVNAQLSVLCQSFK